MFAVRESGEQMHRLALVVWRVGQIWIRARANVVVDESSRFRRGTQEKWRESVSGGELDSHTHMENGLASARYLVKLIESILDVIRENFLVSEELSDDAACSAGPSPHDDCLVDDVFVDDVRGAGIWTTQAGATGGGQLVSWHGRAGARLAKGRGGRRIDTDKGDAD